jgi:hypothetical protein
MCRLNGSRVEKEGTYRQHVDTISILPFLEKEKFARNRVLQLKTKDTEHDLY